MAGQIGLEPTLAEHLDVMVRVFREVRRVLRSDGTCWINYGDCYATAPNGRSAAATKAAGKDDRTFRDKPFSTVGPIYDPNGGAKGGGDRGENKGNATPPSGRVCAGGYLKPKDLCMLPNRLAIALQDDGWWVRSEIIWHKPNPMPESIKDRPAVSHEKVWLLTKSARYFYDAEAVRTERAGDEDANGFRGGSYTGGAPGKRTATGNYRVPAGWATGDAPHTAIDHNTGERKDKQSGGSTGRPGEKTPRGSTPRHDGHIEHTKLDATPRGQGANLRNVWTIATKPFPDAHFATFPPDLVVPCIKAGCPEGGTVLDPFGGAGTTGLVADRLGRDAVLIELNPDYAAIAARRIEGEQGLFGNVTVARLADEYDPMQDGRDGYEVAIAEMRRKHVDTRDTRGHDEGATGRKNKRRGAPAGRDRETNQEARRAAGPTGRQT